MDRGKRVVLTGGVIVDEDLESVFESRRRICRERCWMEKVFVR